MPRDSMLLCRLLQLVAWLGLFCLSPTRPQTPAFVFPTATDPAPGQGMCGLDPRWSYRRSPVSGCSGLLNNVRSFAGHSDRASVNQVLFRYFINYILSKGWYLIMMSWI